MRPILARLPNGLLVDGDNRLDVILTNEPNRYHLLIRFYIGAEADLLRAFAVGRYVATYMPTSSIGIYLMLGFLSS